MEGNKKTDNMPGNRGKKSGLRAIPLQEYDFFVAEEEGQSPQEAAPELRPAKPRKKKEVRNKSKAFFLD
jgi:hypothetical protein